MPRCFSTQVLTLLFVACCATQAWSAREARVRGTVVDSAGNPVALATIEMLCEEREAFNRDIKVDAEGKFAVLIIDATKRYLFKITAEGFLPLERDVKVGAGTTDTVLSFQLFTPEEEQQLVDSAIKEQPGYREFEEGRLLFEQGKLDEAAAKLEQALGVVPDLLPARIGLVKISFRKQEWQPTLDHARKCLEQDQEAADCLALAADACEKLGDTACHEMYLQKLQILNPEDPSMLFNQAAELLNKMDDAGARPLFEQCLQVDADFPPCLFEFGMLLLRTGDLPGAKEKLQRYLEIDPEGAHAATAADTIKYL